MTLPFRGGDTTYTVDKCFDGNSSTICITFGHLNINFSKPVHISSLSISNRLACCQDRLSHLFVNSVRYELGENQTYLFDDLDSVSTIKIFPKDGEELNLSEVHFVYELAPDTSLSDTFCTGFLNSCWFKDKEDFRDVFLSLLSFMVVMFSLAYIGKIIRTGGNS